MFGITPLTIAAAQQINGGAINWQPIPDSPQEMALLSDAEELLFGGQAGGGKGQSCYSIQWAINNLESFTVECYNDIKHLIPQEVRDRDMRVLMWNGQWKSIAALVVGDRIMNPDGQHQNVLSIFERGTQEFYRITFEDGTFVECDSSHKWGFWEARADSRRKTAVKGGKEILDTSIPVNWNLNYISRARVQTTEWLANGVAKGKRFIIPISAPLNYTNLHRGYGDRAYLYGALIGDGTIQKDRNGSGIRLSCWHEDVFIAEKCESLSTNFSRRNQDGNCFDIAFRDDWVKDWARNSGLLGTKCDTKFLPDGYLMESLAFRWNLANGLFDTDGYAAKDKNEVSYSTTSERLASNVADLVRSLGFMAKIYKKQGYCYNKGYEGPKKMAYIVQVQGNQKWRLFSLPRKMQQAQANESMHWVGKRIESVEKIEPTYSRCISVSNPNGLYITDGYNVTHNSDLIIGLSLAHHQRSLILRRRATDLSALISRTRELTGAIGSASIKVGKRLLEFGGCKDESSKSKYRGRPHDLKAFDELSEFTQSQYEFICAWNRTSDPEQRCRIVATTNPPDTNEGRWIIRHWGPWLDPAHPNPATSGEIRWYLDGQEVDGPDPINGKYPRSRTFIRAAVEDNPYLIETGYDRLLDNLPEEIRAALRYGDFSLQIDDNPYQLIPSGWVEAAQARYREGSYSTDGARVLGVDPARGGKDRTVIAVSTGDLVEVHAYPGKKTPNGASVVQLILNHWIEGMPINLDTIGIGASVVDYLRDFKYPVVPVAFSKKSVRKDKSGLLKFVNLRAEIFWALRDELNPQYGATIAIPDDPAIREELTCIRYKLSHSGIQIEGKDDIKSRIGRSIDLADAIALARHRSRSYASAF